MKGYIYKVCSPNTDLIYIGSTTKNLQNRLSSHLFFYNTYGIYSSRLNGRSYKVLEHGDPYIELIEEIDFNHKDELYNLEKKYIIEGGDNLVNKSYKSKSKYYNREKKRENYWQNHEARCQYQRDYRKRIKQLAAAAAVVA
jgi:hypothetical protein